MSEDEFTKLFKYVQGIDHKIDALAENVSTKESMNNLMNTLDAFLKRLDSSEVDMAARDRQFDRLVEWARKVSEKTGVPLENL
jgi:hypothetical protein